MKVRCLIVDDSPGVLAAAQTLLEREGMEVVGTASTGAEALRLAGELQPDITLVDIDLGGESGFDVVEQLAPARTILISTHSEQEFAGLIEASPALGFVSKFAFSAQAIQAILDGHPGG